jgi:E3 ubiquitin-protein ligase BRE1
MSALWENLDKQLKNKIFDLSTMEEKLSKAMTEVSSSVESLECLGLTCWQKSKADNKFFAAMRELDALNAVKAGQAREIAKQTKVIERLVESEKSLNRQLVGPPVWHLYTHSIPSSLTWRKKASYRPRPSQSEMP